MALKLLQPGVSPLGQFDLDDDDTVFGGEILKLATNNSADTAVADAGIFSESRARAQIFSNTTSLGADFAATTSISESGTGPYDENPAQMGLTHVAGAATDLFICLADEGSIEYGTLFGCAIGGTAGQGTQTGVSFATMNGKAERTGPDTTFGSGKITAWDKPGLYGISGDWLWASATISLKEEVAPAAIAPNTVIGPSASPSSQVSTGTLPTGAGAVDTGKWSQFKNADNSIAGADQDADTGCALMIGAMYDRSLVSTTLAAAGASPDVECYAIYFIGNKVGA